MATKIPAEDDAAALPRVRDVHPGRVLMYVAEGEPLRPYLPRAVDRDLDRALARPGMVVMVHDTAAGTRRTAYEALLRNLPNAVLLVDPDLTTLPATPGADAVVWLDRSLSVSHNSRSRRPAPDFAPLESWLSSPQRRWAIAIVGEANLRSSAVEALLAASPTRPTTVRMTAELTGDERAAAEGRYGDGARFHSIEQFVSRQEAAGPTGAIDPGAPEEPPPHRPARRGSLEHLAEYRADTDDGTDRLGITADVRMLADLVSSRLIEPPLSIGLFGSWGAGKSFFMRRMRDRIDQLATAARDAEQAAGRHGPAVSLYCSSVKQITFNAWHYAEANLFASLATHIFDELAGDPDSDVQRRIDDLAAQRGTEQSLLDQLSTVRLERMLLAAQQERQAKRGRTVRAGAATLRALGPEDLSWVAGELGVARPTVEDLRRFADGNQGLGRDLATTGRWLRRDPLPAVVAAGGVLVVAVLALVLGRANWSGLAGVATVLATLGTAMARVRAATARVRAATGDTPPMTAKAVKIRQRLAELDAETERLERAIADLAPGRDITSFATARASGKRYRDDYQQHLGVVSVLRRDLTTFAAMLARERDRTDGSAGVERIVLYIDDLDRCPPTVVVQVLEAIHLLLALPVFAVVVGVDARWLTRAIRQHYAALLDDDSPDDSPHSSGAAFAAHYLEKIFQIPFVLSPMNSTGFAELVTGLTETDRTEDAEWQPNILDGILDEEPASPARSDIPASEDVPAGIPEPAVEPDRPLEPIPDPDSGPGIDLRPDRLAISPPERDFLTTLAPLVRSPRAAKRLVNLYRLLRARLSPADLADLLTRDTTVAPYRAVLVLLAVLVGQPDEAARLFDALRDAPADAPWRIAVDNLTGDSPLREILTGLAKNPDSAPPEPAGVYQRWLPLVSRFSFAAS